MVENNETRRSTVVGSIAVYLAAIYLALRMVMFMFFFASPDLVERLILGAISIGLLILTANILSLRKWAWLVGALVYGLFVVLIVISPLAAHVSLLLDDNARMRREMSLASCITDILSDISVLAAYSVLYFVPPVWRVFRKRDGNVIP